MMIIIMFPLLIVDIMASISNLRRENYSHELTSTTSVHGTKTDLRHIDNKTSTYEPTAIALTNDSCPSSDTSMAQAGTSALVSNTPSSTETSSGHGVHSNNWSAVINSPQYSTSSAQQFHQVMCTFFDVSVAVFSLLINSICFTVQILMGKRDHGLQYLARLKDKKVEIKCTYYEILIKV